MPPFPCNLESRIYECSFINDLTPLWHVDGHDARAVRIETVAWNKISIKTLLVAKQTMCENRISRGISKSFAEPCCRYRAEQQQAHVSLGELAASFSLLYTTAQAMQGAFHKRRCSKGDRNGGLVHHYVINKFDLLCPWSFKKTSLLFNDLEHRDVQVWSRD